MWNDNCPETLIGQGRVIAWTTTQASGRLESAWAGPSQAVLTAPVSGRGWCDHLFDGHCTLVRAVLLGGMAGNDDTITAIQDLSLHFTERPSSLGWQSGRTMPCGLRSHVNFGSSAARPCSRVRSAVGPAVLQPSVSKVRCQSASVFPSGGLAFCRALPAPAGELAPVQPS